MDGHDQFALWLMKMFSSSHLLTTTQVTGLFFVRLRGPWIGRFDEMLEHNKQTPRTRPPVRGPRRTKQIDDYLISHCRAIGVNNKIPLPIHFGIASLFLLLKNVRWCSYWLRIWFRYKSFALCCNSSGLWAHMSASRVRRSTENFYRWHHFVRNIQNNKQNRKRHSIHRTQTHSTQHTADNNFLVNFLGSCEFNDHRNEMLCDATLAASWFNFFL